MSSVPPNLVGPILQSHATQRQASDVRRAETTQQERAERLQHLATDKHDSTVETTDGDTQVHPDAEGSGGNQGRSFTEPEEDLDTSALGSPDPTDPLDGQSGRVIDLEA